MPTPSITMMNDTFFFAPGFAAGDPRTALTDLKVAMEKEEFIDVVDVNGTSGVALLPASQVRYLLCETEDSK